MPNEQTNKTDTEGNKDNPTSANPSSVLEEAKKIRDEIKAENDRRERLLGDEQKLRAEGLLSGTAGGNIPIPTAEEMIQAKAQKLADEMSSAFK